MDQRALVDVLLELSVVPSFSRIGPLVRRRLWDWGEPAPGALAGRTAVVTGATGGLGRETATTLAGLGARVVLVGRNRQRLEDVRSSLVDRVGADRFPVHAADLASLRAVRSLAEAIRASEPRIDVLVDNAGAIHAERTLSADGIEASMALMAVGPFVLVGELLPLLRRSDDARVIAVTSGGMYTQAVDVDDLDGSALAYSGPRFYARAKRVQVGLIREWARRTTGSPISFNAMHPGWARTPGLTESLPGFDRIMGPILRTPAEGVDTIVWLATAPRADIGAGRLFLDRRPRPFDRVPWTRLSRAQRRRLWEVVVARAGIGDPAPD